MYLNTGLLKVDVWGEFFLNRIIAGIKDKIYPVDVGIPRSGNSGLDRTIIKLHVLS